MRAMREVEVIQHPQVRGLSVFLDTVDYRSPHLHREWELLWILDGQIEIHIAQGDLLAERDSLVIFNPKQTHEFHKLGASCTFLCVQFSPQFFSHGFPAAEGLRFDQTLPSQTMPEADCRTIRRMLAELTPPYFRRDPGYELLCAGCLSLVLRKLLLGLPHRVLTGAESQEQERRDQRLERLIDFVDQNHRHKLCLSEFARREGRSMSYMSHFVKENLGQSFQDYVATVRFQTARTLITAGRDRLLDVCAESGFSDYRYFSKAFRERLGVTPEEYRLQALQAGPDAAHAQNPRSMERFYTSEESLRLFEELTRRL